eukprot:3978793-Amphidinium_carterae.1
MLLLRGKHLLRHSSTVQAAKSEHYALTKGTLVERASCSDEERCGKNTRHIQACLLWLQERVAAKRLLVRKVHTEVNPAAVLTKALAEVRTKELCQAVGQVWLSSETAAAVSSLLEEVKSKAVKDSTPNVASMPLGGVIGALSFHVR